MTKKPVSTNLQEYKAQSGHLDPVYTLEIELFRTTWTAFLMQLWPFIPWPMGGTDETQV